MTLIEAAYEELRAKRKPRPRNRMGTGRLDEGAIEAAYARHVTDGLSTRELAKELWQRHGYASPVGCRNSLRSAFRVRGMNLRSRSDAMRKVHGGPTAASGAALSLATGKTEFGSREYRQAVEAAQKNELAHIPPEVAELLSEQEMDECFGWYVRKPWELSLDAPLRESNDTLKDLIDQDGFTRSQSGRSFSDAWTDVVCAVVDQRREIDQWAEAA